MGFVLDGLDAEEYDRTYDDRTLVKRILDYFKPHRGKMVLVASMVVIASLTEAIIPVLVSQGIDLLAANPTAQILVGIAALTVVIGSLSWIFNFIRQKFTAIAVADVVLALREDTFSAVMHHDLSFYDRFSSGRIVSRVTSDTQDFSAVITLTIELIGQILMILLVCVILFWIQPFLAMLTIAIAPVVVLAALAFRRIARWSSQRGQRATAEVNANIQESISGISVAKNFRQEASIYEQFRTTNQLAYKVRLVRGFIMNIIFPTLDVLSAIAIAIIIYVGGSYTLQGTLSAGDWYLFVQTLGMFIFPLTSIASFWSQFQQGLSASERVFALIDAEPKVIQTGNEPVPQLEGRITFDHVWFGYDETAAGSAQTVLRDFSLDIPAGQTIAVVGHTGAGKSSLARLVMRFYEFQQGQILIDGRDIRTLDLGEYRQKIGIVPQVPFLFSGTVADNIRYGRPDADDATILAVAQKLGDDWIEDLPNGLETEVGERGARLSLGQRQLVALARVLLQDPSIFILDEATASIDPFTEAQIQEGLDVVMEHRTSIVIAHRLSTVRNADRIIVMSAGQIIEEGTHDQLLIQGGHYASLYNTYFRHQSLEYIEQVGSYGAD
jgi:ATP-binding cassette subfamily B protein